MTEEGARSSGLSLFRLEGERSASGMSIIFGGVVGVNRLSDESVEMKSHGARVHLSGRRLRVTLYENRSVEISGRIESIEFIYGKGR